MTQGATSSAPARASPRSSSVGSSPTTRWARRGSRRRSPSCGAWRGPRASRSRRSPGDGSRLRRGIGAMSTWPADAVPWVVALWAGLGYAVAWRQVNARHPQSRISTLRLVAWLGGLVAILAALASPLDGLTDELLTAHMVQHLLLTMVAPPLMA